MKHKNLCFIFPLIFVFSFNNQTIFANSPQAVFSESRYFYLEKFWRTELYFGMNKQDGSVVSEEDWSKFLVEEVTPRFPAGFTVLEGFGQFRDESGKIVKEKSRVLIVFYTKKEKRASGEKIEQIREAYKQKFQQESVLRLDFRQTVSVSF